MNIKFSTDDNVSLSNDIASQTDLDKLTQRVEKMAREVAMIQRQTSHCRWRTGGRRK